jgi:hypothetical protein
VIKTIYLTCLSALLIVTVSVSHSSTKSVAKKAPQKKSVATASLRGSPASMARQNHVANLHDLSRIADSESLDSMCRANSLVPLPSNRHIRINQKLDRRRRFCLPWTRTYLEKLAAEYHKLFGEPLQVNSAVRTVAHQKTLRVTNGNAAPATGPTASSHLTGATVDIAKLPCSAKGLAWLRTRLLADEQAGLIEATEEFQQAVFHVMVFKKAVPP